MNYYAHGWRFVANPYFLAGTAVPDWLNVVDRKVRARAKAARSWTDDPNPAVAAIARGIVQHHADDHWFHQTRVFYELTSRFTLEIRARLPDDDGLRPSFLGHILVELLLDSALIVAQPAGLDDYYRSVESLDPDLVRHTVERISGRELPALPRWIPRFCSERFLYDYQQDGKLLARLNAVMLRVGLRPLPETLLDWFPEARRRVSQHRDALLADADGGSAVASPTTSGPEQPSENAPLGEEPTT